MPLFKDKTHICLGERTRFFFHRIPFHISSKLASYTDQVLLNSVWKWLSNNKAQRNLSFILSFKYHWQWANLSFSHSVSPHIFFTSWASFVSCRVNRSFSVEPVEQRSAAERCLLVITFKIYSVFKHNVVTWLAVIFALYLYNCSNLTGCVWYSN